MTPNAVAVASNIYPERLRETLTGKKLPSSHQLKRLSGFFGVSTKDIITLKNQEILTMQQNATASLKPLPAAGEQPVSEL
jgi:hypothetical protein